MQISLVVPAHNEVDNLERLVARVHEVVRSDLAAHEVTVVLVDDNSTDGTGELVDRLAADHPSVRAVHRTDAPGFGNAVKAGLEVADGDVVIPFMADLSDDPADVPALVAAIEAGYDVAYGSRFVEGGSVEGYPPLKLLYNRAFNNLIRLLFGLSARDVTNAFTAYRREVLDEVGVDSLAATGFDLTAELPLRAHIDGFESTEVPVSWHSREAGVSKLNATRKGPQYLRRLAHLFVVGNVAGLRDLFQTVSGERPSRILFSTLLGVVLLVGLFSLSGFGEVFSLVARVDGRWLAVAAVAYLGSFAFRTWRFRVLLRTMGHLAERGDVFRSIMTGWFVNFILPARVGDAVRGLALKTTQDVPFSVASGAVVVERILDMAVLSGVLLLVSLGLGRTTQFRLLTLGALAIAATMLVGLVVLYRFEEPLAARLESRFPQIRAGLDALAEGLDRVARNPYAVGLALLVSLPVWLLEMSTIYFSARSVGIDLTAVAWVASSAAAFVAQAVPLTAAGIGTYEATITGVLGLFGVEPSAGTALALVDHFVRIGLVYVVGGLTTIHIGFRSRAYFRQQRLLEEGDEGVGEADGTSTDP